MEREGRTMTETKFTPGPWETYLVDRDVVVIRKMTHDGEQELQQIARCTSGFDNAHLIAAAPELYAIVDRLVNYRASENDGVPLVDNDRFFDEAMEALAKARGES